MKKIVKLTEDQIERMVVKILKEEENQPKQGNTVQMQKLGDGVLPTIDDIVLSIQKAKMHFEQLCNSKLTGRDGYSKEIDGIVNDFTKLEDKVRKSKETISNFMIQKREKEKTDHMQHMKMQRHNKREETQRKGGFYNY